MGITFSRCQDLYSFLLWPRAWTDKSQNKPISDFSEQHLTCNLYKWIFPLIIVFWFFKISLPHWAGTILGDSNGVMLVVTDRLDIAQDFISLQPFHRKNIAVMAEVHCCTYSFLFKRHDTKHVKYKKPSRLVAAETSLKMAFHVNDLPFGERILGSSCIDETRLLVISLGPPSWCITPTHLLSQICNFAAANMICRHVTIHLIWYMNDVTARWRHIFDDVAQNTRSV